MCEPGDLPEAAMESDPPPDDLVDKVKEALNKQMEGE